MTSRQVIVDASVIVKWLNQEREQLTKEAFDILEQAECGTLSLLTSDLATHEVLNALIRGKGLRERMLEFAVHAFFDLPLVFLDTNFEIASLAAIIAEKHGVTFYDAVYSSIASIHQCPLVTANPKHQKSTTFSRTIPLGDWQIHLV